MLVEAAAALIVDQFPHYVVPGKNNQNVLRIKVRDLGKRK
jgi:hypothetical protein